MEQFLSQESQEKDAGESGDNVKFGCGDFPVACWIFLWTCSADSQGHMSLELIGEMKLVELDLIKAMGLENIQEVFIEREGSQDEIAQDTNIKERYKEGLCKEIMNEGQIQMERSGDSETMRGEIVQGRVMKCLSDIKEEIPTKTALLVWYLKMLGVSAGWELLWNDQMRVFREPDCHGLRNKQEMGNYGLLFQEDSL